MMLSKDQLTKAIKLYQELNGFTELKIHFMPTYKFEEATKEYDKSKKKRVPSWCDRVLLHLCDDDEAVVKQTRYESKEILWSDHMPVIANFSIKRNKTDEGFKDFKLKRREEVRAKKPIYDPNKGAIHEKIGYISI